MGFWELISQRTFLPFHFADPAVPQLLQCPGSPDLGASAQEQRGGDEEPQHEPHV